MLIIETSESWKSGSYRGVLVIDASNPCLSAQIVLEKKCSLHALQTTDECMTCEYRFEISIETLPSADLSCCLTFDIKCKLVANSIGFTF